MENNAAIYSSTFNLRQGYDVVLDVRGNGQVQSLKNAAIIFMKRETGIMMEKR